jgi:hypothetical protein
MKYVLTCFLILMAYGAQAQHMKGPLKLVEEANEDAAPEITGKSGAVEYSLKVKHGDFFDSPVITPYPNVKNTGSKKVEFTLALALFDASGNLLIAHSQNSDLDPGEDTQMASFLMYMPTYDDWKKVASYQLVTFTRDAE